MNTAADRNLLFGLLALQNGVVNQVQLVAAFQAWTLDKSRSLADHLEARGDLTVARRALLEALAELHLEAHGGEVVESLAAVSAGGSTMERLARLDDPDIEATLGHVGSARVSTEDDADRTSSYAVGSATSDGQRFRVLRPHARGGLGAVFVALDGELNREVAVKQILDHHADDPASRQRFLVEAEITGGLEHPGIVPVYGLGTYGGGRPYYAMRFIKGDSLKEAIQRFHGDAELQADPGRRSLELRKLLRRFTDVCNAIEYAHSRGVLHRDVKPGNVIVGKHGETLVVDWGLAKPLGKVAASADEGERVLMPSSASGSAETLPGSALGTPAYMSPEQAVGDLDRLGARSDVYSLGATLYCLLTGEAPFDGEIGEVLRKVQQGDFMRPRQLVPPIDPALEAVCLKAMATRPEDRYASCRALAEDLERWAADEPVTAWSEPFGRRARRWAKRNRTAVTGAAVALVAGVVGLSAVLAVQSKAKAEIAQSLVNETRANTALAAANSELIHSKAAVQARYDLAVDAIRTFHTGVSEDFLLKQNEFKELRDRLLKSASDFYGKLAALLGKESDLASRRALAQANFEVAELTGKVGRGEDALAAHRAVLAQREELASDPSADAEAKVDVGRSLTAVASLLESTGKSDEAEATYRQAESLLADLARSSPSIPAARTALAFCRSNLGYFLLKTGKSDDALTALRLAQADQEAAAAIGSTNEAARNLPSTCNFIGILLAQTGKPAEAEAEFRKAIAIQKTLAKDNPVVADFLSGLAGIHNNLGNLLLDTGESAEAEAEYREAIAIQKTLAKDNPAVADFRSRLAKGHNNLGNLLSNTGKPAAAEAEYRKAIAIFKTLADDNPAVAEFLGSLATSHNNLGALLLDTGESAEAEAEYRKAIAILKTLVDDNPAVADFRNELADSHNSLGILLKHTGKPEEAEAEFRKTIVIQKTLADDNPAVTNFRGRLAASYTNLGTLLWITGDPVKAEAELRKAIAIFKTLADDNPAVTNFRQNLGTSHNNLGVLLKDTGNPVKADAELRKAIAIFKTLADDNPAVTNFRNELSNSHGNLGALLGQTGKPAEAEAEIREAIEIKKMLADDNPAVADFRSGLAIFQSNLANVLCKSGRLVDARAACERARALLEPLVKEHPEVTDHQSGLAEIFQVTGLVHLDAGNLAGASDSWRRAVALLAALKSLNGEQAFLRSCCHASLAGLAARPGSGVSVEEGRAESDRAVDWVRRAVELGHGDPNAYRIETALDPIRDRAEFRLLMMDLVMPAEPFARGD